MRFLYSSSGLLHLNSLKEYITWLAQRRLRLSRIQSFTVPFNSTPVIKFRTILKPRLDTSCDRYGASRLLQVIMIRLGEEKICMYYKRSQLKNEGMYLERWCFVAIQTLNIIESFFKGSCICHFLFV